MSSEEQAYSDGHKAHYSGYTLKHNPHKRFSPEWEQWREGWLDDSKEDKSWSNLRKIQRNARRRFARKNNLTRQSPG